MALAAVIAPLGWGHTFVLVLPLVILHLVSLRDARAMHVVLGRRGLRGRRLIPAGRRFWFVNRCRRGRRMWRIRDAGDAGAAGAPPAIVSLTDSGITIRELSGLLIAALIALTPQRSESLRVLIRRYGGRGQDGHGVSSGHGFEYGRFRFMALRRWRRPRLAPPAPPT
jgi:hypothetical protein